MFLKAPYFQNSVHPESRHYLQIALSGKVFQFKAFMFWPFHSISGLHQSVLSGIGVGLQGKEPAILLTKRLADLSRVNSSGLPGHHKLLLYLSEPEDCH